MQRPTQFTLEQINDIHDRLGTMESFAQYILTLRAVGVEKYDTYITDGHSEYFGMTNKVVSSAVHETLIISDISDSKKAREQLDLHNKGKTSYMEMSRGMAESGVEKWTVNTKNMTFICYDKQGNELLTIIERAANN